MDQTINIIDTKIIGAITVIGVLVAIFIYLKNRRTEQKNIIRSMLAQLDSLSSWASANTEGWHDPPTPAQKLRYLRIFDVIYRMNHGIIDQALILPGIIDFSDDFIKTVAKFNQNIDRIHSLLEFRNNLIFQKYELAKSIRLKLDKYKRDHENEDFNEKEFYRELSKEEKFLAKILYKCYSALHSTCIGNGKKNGLKQNFHIIENELQDKISSLNDPRVIAACSMLVLALFYFLGSIIFSAYHFFIS